MPKRRKQKSTIVRLLVNLVVKPKRPPSPSRLRRHARKPKSPDKLEIQLKSFYCSKEWATARYKAIKSSGGKCTCCGRSPKDGIKLVVDHIKPVRYFWDLRLNQDNLQVLCNMCNRGKGSWDETDWRDDPTEELSLFHGFPLH